MKRHLVAVATALACALVVPGQASAEDPPYLGWPGLLPAAPGGYSPSSEDDCVKGRN